VSGRFRGVGAGGAGALLKELPDLLGIST
jgi:hypothetical protein